MIASAAPDSLGEWALGGWLLAIAIAVVVVLALGRASARPTKNAAPAPATEPVRARAHCNTHGHYFRKYSGLLWQCANCPELRVVDSPDVFNQDAHKVVELAEAITREAAR